MPNALPKQFEFGHDLSFVLHDLIEEHLAKGEAADLLNCEFHFKRDEDSKVAEGLSGVALCDWCEANGYGDVIEEASYRGLVAALIADFCHFVYEGLKCSAKGKLSVAFSNFRKPLQDHLLYLEWILTDRSGFWGKFRTGAKQFDAMKLARNKTDCIATIQKAIDLTDLNGATSAEVLYELRYEKATDVGLDPIFNQAVHLVTTNRHYTTLPQNINFVFCNDDDRERLWGELYRILPLTLLHALEVIRALFKTFAPEFKPCEPLTEIWLAAGVAIWSDKLGDEDSTESATASFQELITEANLKCPACRESLEVPKSSLEHFWQYGEIICGKCNAVMPILVPKHTEHADCKE